MPTWLDSLIRAAAPYILKALGLGGFFGWLGNLAMKYGGQALYDLISDVIRKLKRKGEQEIAKNKDLPIISNPDPAAPIDDKGKAYEDLINSGRH